MFYKLNCPYRLRGWQKRARVLVRRPDNKTRDLPEIVFQTLLLCDGITELEDDTLTNEMREILTKYEQEGIISSIDEPQEIDEIQLYRFYDNRYVKSIFWSITGRCNYKCRHCYMDAPEAALGELSTEQALDFIDQMADCGVLKVDITGGEPFVRKDFWTLVDKLTEKEIIIGMVYTNGWLLTERVLENFEERGMHPEFSISFDGLGWHDWMRGVQGAEDAALRAFRFCKEHGFSVNVEMCVHKGNIRTLGDTVKKLADSGIWSIKVGHIMNTELWCRNSEGNAISSREYYEEMISFIPKFFKIGRPLELEIGSIAYLYTSETAKVRNKHFDVLAERFDGTESCLNCHLCNSARWACYITPDGRLLPCMPMTASPDQTKFPFIRDIGLKQGLTDGYYMRYVDNRVKDLFAVNAECAACEYRYRCGGGCRAAAMVEGDRDLMGADRSQCILWKEGYAQRIRQTAEDAVAKYCKEAEE